MDKEEKKKMVRELVMLTGAVLIGLVIMVYIW